MKTNIKIIKTFRDLIVWQKSHDLTLEIYRITSKFPAEERYGLTSQLRRAAYSIPSNIVEGHSRKSRKEFLQFLNIAKGSLEELKYFLILSFDLKYVDYNTKIDIEQKAEEVSKILYSFTNSLKITER
jgi:four helix bundle protein